MPLSWNEIKSRALAFSNEWADESSESAEAKSFWNEFFNVFGIKRRRVASFEEHVKKLSGKDGFIDLLWKGTLLVEHKSRGKSLDGAHSQALDYFAGLKEHELPRYVLVSDFARFRLYDLDEDTQQEFNLEDLHKNVNLFGFIAGYQTKVIKEQDPVNIKAAERMGKLHDQLKDQGYDGHVLEVYLVRLLFCLFAEDTGIFQLQQFQDFIDIRTSEDGSDLGGRLSTLFQVLNKPVDKRQKNLDEQVAEFPYINGKLFEEILPTASFNSGMRTTLLECCALDWGSISPAIFGSLFQSIMDKKKRRNLGAHYTSEKNILKLINPLFMDELHAEFDKLRKLKREKGKRLTDFHKKLRDLKFLDPACGCGNFLVIAYRELRMLELDILRELNKSGQTSLINVHEMVYLDVDQFYGIEIEEFPAQIAQVAMWLMDHQMNQLVSSEFGLYFARIPLASSANVVHENALRIDWNDVVHASELDYIIGNPPFIGKQEQKKEQKADFKAVVTGIKRGGTLDFVCAWYIRAIEYVDNFLIDIAFVSTNSITQGEQVPVLWSIILSRGYQIKFAHRTFCWKNKARNVAAVHCIIVGLSKSVSDRQLFDYENVNSESLMARVSNISPYLVNNENVLIGNRSNPICNVPIMSFGSMPNDGGNLLLSEQEKDDFVRRDNEVEEFIKPFLGSHEFISAEYRYCIWLKDVKPNRYRKIQDILARIALVKEKRLSSSRKQTRLLAESPYLFGEIRQPSKNFLAVPKTSSSRRKFIPIGFLQQDYIASTELFTIEDANLYDFAVLNSTMHMSWVRTICGRLKSDYRYSAGIVYNNFPWPKDPTEKQKERIVENAQAVLDARATHPEASLADLYDPLTMPPNLLKAHQALDKAVDAAYGRKKFESEAERVAFLFDLYQEYTSLLPADKPKKTRRKKKS